MFKERFLFYFSIYRELIVTSFVILACLALLFFFPAKNYFQTITASVFFLFLIPLLYLKIVTKNTLFEFGLNWENKKDGLIWGLVLFFASVVIFFLLYFFTDFKNKYILPDSIIHSFPVFLFYELIVINFLIFLLEFFFCGFVFFSFAKHISYWAIPIQFILFATIAILTFGFSWQIFPALVISLNSGIITYRSRSIIFAHMSALLSFIILDSLIIHYLK